ncbi:hypothetical protein [Halospeciosus flavus]|uniref:Uncharacterized protein n=1 Tax=Halospeciosus flavus TaxID=3032283 RepID=A0ABD5Z2U3_9EURY|nr:hypothetical protein [Halospeciosus flavus]
MDIGLDSNFDISLDHRNDVPLVRGRAEFEQRLAIRLTSYYTELVGENADVNIAALLKLEASRVADEEDSIDNVQSIIISPDPDAPNTVEVRVVYATGEDFLTTLSE